MGMQPHITWQLDIPKVVNGGHKPTTNLCCVFFAGGMYLIYADYSGLFF